MEPLIEVPPLPRGAVALALVKRWRAAAAGGVLYLATGESDAEYLGANIHGLFPDCEVLVLPRWDCLPYDPGGPSREIMGRRASVLRRLAQRRASQPLVISTVEAVLQRVPPRHIWKNATLTLRVGDPLDAEDLRRFLQHTGYLLDAVVDEPGEAALHGQVFDIFPGGALGPARIELADGRIAAISAYDPLSQRVTAALSEITLDAASELIGVAPEGNQTLFLSQHYEQLETVFDYLPQILLLTAPGIRDRAVSWLDQVSENHESAAALHDMTAPPAPDCLYLGRPEWEVVAAAADTVRMPESSATAIPNFAIAAQPNRAYRQFLAEQLEAGQRVLLTAADARDLQTMIRRAAVPASRVESWQHVLEAEPGAVLALQIDFDSGFVMPETATTVIAAANLLGSRARHVVPMAIARDPDALGGEAGLHIDGPVVHLDHGRCLLRGLETIAEPSGAQQDTIRLEFAGGTALMVPVHDIASIWAYGVSGPGISLDRLNGDAWAKRKAEVEADIAKTARSFAALIEQHNAQEAVKLTPSRVYERFTAGFPYDLTPDQAKAIEDVLGDLQSGRPMDRLLSGDVGFGKTEVALRAVAAAVLSGRQAAIMVPTTVLARQHLETFRRRFAAFDIRVELLSRVRTSAETRVVKQGLRDGTVQIVIGTHAIADRNLRFKNLALIVIDEEQRFGTRIKEKLRDCARDLHVLTMSATPIPRTLQRAVVGLQQFSTLETPPARRLPVRTSIANFDATLVRDALTSEQRRNGQSFVVCPHIEDLKPMAAQLHEIVPQLHVTLVHGKMPADEIDTAIIGFAGGRGDILLTTNIIETGLDIPRANTILIWRPDRFGAAQLHQLRGRVGRGRRRGLAYLLTDPAIQLPMATRKRLETVAELDALGAGFAVSRRDLDLRGGGDLLGEAQTGHIKAIGVELYRYLLQQALENSAPLAPAEDNLDLPAANEAANIPDPEARINLYARLARLRDPGMLDDFADEVEERFGPMPPAMASLIAIRRIAELAATLGISRIDAGPQGIALTTSRPLHHKDWQRHGDRYVVQRATGTDERIPTLLQLLEDADFKVVP